MRTIAPLVAATVTLLAGCTANVGVSSSVKVPKDAAQQCRTHCADIGMKLGAVAIMASEVGCVCQLEAASGGESAAISAGMATIAMQRASRAQQQQQQQQYGRGGPYGRGYTSGVR